MLENASCTGEGDKLTGNDIIRRLASVSLSARDKQKVHQSHHSLKNLKITYICLKDDGHYSNEMLLLYAINIRIC